LRPRVPINPGAATYRSCFEGVPQTFVQMDPELGIVSQRIYRFERSAK
jgi:hypothetical protein